MGVLFGYVPQVGVALKYSHLTECGPWARATVMDTGHTVSSWLGSAEARNCVHSVPLEECNPTICKVHP